MTVRTIPASMPALRRGEYNIFKAIRAVKIRALVQAQNWLWANMVRLHSFWAYEGHGNTMNASQVDPILETDIYGATAKLLLAFVCPPNWGGGDVLAIYGKVTSSVMSAGFLGRITCAAYDTDGVYLGVKDFAEWVTDGDDTWAMSLTVPQDRTCVVKVWLAPTLSFGKLEAVPPEQPDWVEIPYVCARYIEGTAADTGSGDAPPAEWQPIDHAYITTGENQILNAALLHTIVGNLHHLFTQRPPMVLATYLGRPYANDGATYAEVARYVVKLSPHVTRIGGTLRTFCSHGGAGNDVRVLVDGVVQETFSALAALYTTQTLATIAGLTSGAEITITVEARSTAALSDWGTEVLGVSIWEEDVTLGLPGASTVPAAYVPVDETTLQPDKPILESTFQTIIQNTTWLMANRLKNLVHDWRHRAYRNNGITVASPNSIHEGGNWTRGYADMYATADGYVGHPKNITVYGNATPDLYSGSTDPEDQDGQGTFSTTTPGQTGAGFVSDSSWPNAPVQPRHGRRLGRFLTTGPAAYAPISTTTQALLQLWVRANRARPHGVYSFDGGSTGPLPSESAFEGEASIRVYAETQATELERLTISGRGGPDYLPAVYGPAVFRHADVGTGSLRGRLTSKLPVPHPLEGAYFEVELRSCLLMDAPLTNAALALL